jgi:hypothetical protein
MDENLAAQAELALELQGNYESLCYEGQWHTNGQLAERAARLAAPGPSPAGPVPIWRRCSTPAATGTATSP